MGDYQDSVNSVSDLSGRWYFHAIEIPAMGIRRISDEGEEYYFDFYPERKAVVHIHGDTYTAPFAVKDHFISFKHIKLAAWRLQIADGLLYLRNYLGATLIFSRQVLEKETEM